MKKSVIFHVLLITFVGLLPEFAKSAEPKWDSLIPGIDPAKQQVAGDWTVTGNELSVRAAQGARLTLGTVPKDEYDLRATFTRRTGQHSIGLVVVHGGRQVVFEVDAWGSHLAGFQNVDGKTIQENATRRENVRLENNKRYTVTVEVRKGQLRGLLDGKELAKLTSDGSNLSIPDVWRFPQGDQLGLVAWDCDTTFHSVDLRALSSDVASVPRTAPPPKAPTVTRPSNPAPATPAATAAAGNPIPPKLRSSETFAEK